MSLAEMATEARKERWFDDWRQREDGQNKCEKY